MNTPRKWPTIRSILAVMQRELNAHEHRLGEAEIEGWVGMSATERSETMKRRWPELPRLQRQLLYLQAKMMGIGRRKGARTKLTPEDVKRIKENGRTGITALAKELGVTRQTIHNVLGKKPKPEDSQPVPKPRKPKFVQFNEAIHNRRDGDE